MKKILLRSSIFFFLILLTNCSGDDENSQSDMNLIYGTWKPIRFVIDCFPSTMGNENVEEYSICQQQTRLVFSSSSNNSNSSTNGSYSETRYNDFKGDCVQGEWNGTFNMEGDFITLTIDGGNSTQRIFELTDTTLKIGTFDSTCNGGEPESIRYEELIRVN